MKKIILSKKIILISALTGAVLLAGASVFYKKSSDTIETAQPSTPISAAVNSAPKTENDSDKCRENERGENEVVKDPWLNGYSYRKPVVLNNATSTVTNYQIPIIIDSAALIGASKMQSDCDDVRVTTADGYTLMDHYTESGCNTATTTIWAEVPGIASGTSTIFVYYGSASSTSASNGTNTFLFFDDFELNDFTRWTSASSGWSTQATTTMEGFYAAQGTSGGRILYKTLTTGSVVIHGQCRYNTTVNYPFYVVRNYVTDSGIFSSLFMTAGRFWYYDGGANRELPISTVYNTTTWYKFDVAIDLENSLGRWWIDGASKGEAALVDSHDHSLTGSDLIDFRLVTAGAGAQLAYLDQYWVRKYIYPEPAASVGGEVQLITQAGTGATNWSWKAPASGDYIKNGTSTNWVWTDWHDDNSGVIVPYSTSTDWTWYPQ